MVTTTKILLLEVGVVVVGEEVGVVAGAGAEGEGVLG